MDGYARDRAPHRSLGVSGDPYRHSRAGDTNSAAQRPGWPGKVGPATAASRPRGAHRRKPRHS